MALEATYHRTAKPAITGRIMPTPTSAWQIPELPTPNFYPRMHYAEMWKITGATSATTFYQAALANSLPRPGSAGLVENNTTLTVVGSVDLQKTDNETVWFATVNYEPNPLILPLEIVVQTTHQHRERYFGYYKESPSSVTSESNRAAIQLANNRPLEPPLYDDEASSRIELVKRMQSFNQAWPAEYADHQNKTNFLGFTPGRVKCSDIRGVLTYDPVTHYLVTAIFEVHKTCWAHHIPEVGYEYWDTSTQSIRCDQTVPGTNQAAIPYRVKLNRDGTKRADSEDVLESLWDTLPYADFTRLPLLL